MTEAEKNRATRHQVPDETVAELEQQGIPPGTYDFKALSVMRRTIARRLTESARDIPHFSLTVKVELDALAEHRSKINSLGDAGKISLNDMFIRACALALKRVPEANVSYTAKGLAFHRQADISVAVATDEGLIAPIMRGVESKGLHDISREMKDLAERGRKKKLVPNEYFGGTFTLSNLGMFGISSFDSILNPPQSSILSLGAGERQTRYRGQDPYSALVMNATLTCDHRAVDGAIGAQWLAAFKEIVEKPEGLVA